jgi:hypothetical protein
MRTLPDLLRDPGVVQGIFGEKGNPSLQDVFLKTLMGEFTPVRLFLSNSDVTAVICILHGNVLPCTTEMKVDDFPRPRMS